MTDIDDLIEESEGFNNAEEMFEDMIKSGVDLDIDYVTFIEIDDQNTKIVEKGHLLVCIKKAMSMASESEGVIPYVASVRAYAERMTQETPVLH